MGQTSKPLRIIILDADIYNAVSDKLVEKGHTVKFLTNADEIHAVIGSKAGHITMDDIKAHPKMLDLLLSQITGEVYPKVAKPRKAKVEVKDGVEDTKTQVGEGETVPDKPPAKRKRAPRKAKSQNTDGNVQAGAANEAKPAVDSTPNSGADQPGGGK